MAMPLVLSFTMRSAFTFVDTIFAATIGDDAQGAIGLTVPFEFLMIAAWVGMSTGLTSRLSAAMGAREGEKIEQLKRTTFRLIFVMSPVFIAVAAGIYIAAPRLGLAEDLGHQFQIYGTVLIGGSACISFWSVVPDSIVKAHQDTRSTMWAGILSNVLNVSLNTLFIFVFHWGVFGIALSTVLGRIGGLSYALVRARFHERQRLAEGADTIPGLDPHPFRSIFSLAIPASLTFALMAAENAVINTLLATAPNSEYSIAAYSIYHRVLLFALTPVIAFGVALLPYTARRFGLQDVDAVRKGLFQAGVVSAGYSLLIAGPALLIGAPHLAQWLGEAEQTVQYATWILRIAPLVCVSSVPFLLSRPIFEGMGRGNPGLWMAALRYLVLAAPLGLLGMQLARGMGAPPLYGLVVALVVASAIASTAFAVWLQLALVAWKGDVLGAEPVRES